MTVTLLDKVRLLEAVGTGDTHSPLALKVLLHVVMCMDNATGCSRIGTARLAERAGTSKRSVLRALAELEASGALPVAWRGGSTRNGAREANVYRPNLSYGHQSQGLTGDTHATGAPVSPVTENSMTGAPVSATGAPVSLLPSFSPGGIPEGEEEVSAPLSACAGAPAAGGRTVADRAAAQPEGFGEFWAACPKQVKKAEARIAFQRAVNSGEVAPVTLIMSMRQYAGSVAGIANPRWIKHAHTWIEERRWEDNPRPPKTKESKPRPKAADMAEAPAWAKKSKREAAVGGGRAPTRSAGRADGASDIAPSPVPPKGPALGGYRVGDWIKAPRGVVGRVRVVLESEGILVCDANGGTGSFRVRPEQIEHHTGNIGRW